MSRPAAPRLPFAPLEVVAGAPTIGVLAGWIGVTSRTIHRWANDGIPSQSADEVAIAIGSHPSYVWPDQWGRG